jgi:hypothetical protein
LVARLEELCRKLPIGKVGVEVCWDRRLVEPRKQRVEFDSGIVVGDDILQEKEVDVPSEVLKQVDE